MKNWLDRWGSTYWTILRKLEKEGVVEMPLAHEQQAKGIRLRFYKLFREIRENGHEMAFLVNGVRLRIKGNVLRFEMWENGQEAEIMRKIAAGETPAESAFEEKRSSRDILKEEMAKLGLDESGNPLKEK